MHDCFVIFKTPQIHEVAVLLNHYEELVPKGFNSPYNIQQADLLSSGPSECEKLFINLEKCTAIGSLVIILKYQLNLGFHLRIESYFWMSSVL